MYNEQRVTLHVDIFDVVSSILEAIRIGVVSPSRFRNLEAVKLEQGTKGLGIFCAFSVILAKMFEKRFHIMFVKGICVSASGNKI